MRAITTDQALGMHEQLVRATGGPGGVRDRAALESALYHAFASFEGRDVYPALEEKAARQAYVLVHNHPFVDGNKRTGLLVMLTSLAMGRVSLHFEQDDLVKLGLGLADGSLSPAELVSWILSHKP